MPMMGSESTDNKSLRELRDAVLELNSSTKWNNRIMIVLTFISVILAVILTFPTIKEWFN